MPPPEPAATTTPPDDPNATDGDLGDMLQELRILLQGSQVLTGFLIVLPFAEGFAKLDQAEKWVYLATFICALTSLVLFSAPAAHHRIERPLPDREAFKHFATRMILSGLASLSLSLILATQLVVAEVLGLTASYVVSGAVALLVGIIWWALPLVRKLTHRRRASNGAAR